MTIQLSISVGNARLDAIEADIGVSAVLKIRTGAVPANCGTADSGTVLATLNLPADWMAAASARSKAKSGDWEDASADASGDAGHFRIYDSGGSVCDIQGTVTIQGGGGDMELNSSSLTFTAGQAFSVSTFTLTDANA